MGASEQLRCDLGLGLTVRGLPRDLLLLWCELIAGVVRSRACVLTGRLEHVVRDSQLHASVAAAALSS